MDSPKKIPSSDCSKNTHAPIALAQCASEQVCTRRTRAEGGSECLPPYAHPSKLGAVSSGSRPTPRRLAVSPVQQTLMIFYRGGDGGAGGALVVGGILLHLGISASNYSTTCRCQLVCTTNIQSFTFQKSVRRRKKMVLEVYTGSHALKKTKSNAVESSTVSCSSSCVAPASSVDQDVFTYRGL